MSPAKLMILSALERVFDPEAGLDVVAMGLIYDLRVLPDSVRLKISLTSPGCPMGEMLVQMCENAVASVAGGREVSVQLIWDPPWSPGMISEEGKAQLGR